MLDGEIQSAPHVNEPIYGGSAVITGRFYRQGSERPCQRAWRTRCGSRSRSKKRAASLRRSGTDSIRSGVVAGSHRSGARLRLRDGLLPFRRRRGILRPAGKHGHPLRRDGDVPLRAHAAGHRGHHPHHGHGRGRERAHLRAPPRRNGRRQVPATALEAAYDKAFSAIFDANVTTLITAVILFWQATGSVQGFAVTLTLGIVASMFSALLVTRTIFRWLIERFGLKKLTMLDLIPKRKFDFLGQRVTAAIVSAVLIGGSIIIFAVRGEKNFGIDFRGGDLLVVDSKQPVTVAEARRTLEGIGLGDVVIQFEREGMQDRLSVRSPQGTSAKILSKLQETFPDRNVIAVSQENVGPQIGLEFAKRAALALGLGMIGILIYVTLRFEFSFALGAVVALLHDVIITMGVFSLIGGELSLVMVGAILTIAGYSINDTIVVFDRIREGLKHRERGSIQIADEHVHQRDLGPNHPHRRHNPALRRGPLFLRRRRPARFLLRHSHRHSRRNLLLDLHRLADRPLVVQTAREEHPPRSPRSRGHEPRLVRPRGRR